MLFFKLILIRQLKLFLIIFLALQIIFIVIEYMTYSNDLAHLAGNIKVLFLFYEFIHALRFTIVLSIILSALFTLSSLMKNNELIALQSLGSSKKHIMMPIFILSSFIIFLHMMINMTPLAYAKENINAIVNDRFLEGSRRNFFIKYKDKYIYFGKIYPLLYKAINIRIFVANEHKITDIIKAKEATFEENKWILKDVRSLSVPQEPKISKTPIKITKQESMDILQGFKPSIFDTLDKNEISISIIDGFNILKLFKGQKVNLDKIEAVLYSTIFFPFFAPLFSIIVIYWFPAHHRYINMPLVISMFVFSTMIIWAIFFSASQLSLSGVLPPSVGTILPILALAMISFYFFKKSHHV